MLKIKNIKWDIAMHPGIRFYPVQPPQWKSLAK